MKYVDIGCVNRKLLFIIVFFYSVIEIVKCFFYKYKVLDIEVDDIEFCLEESLLMFLSDLYYLEVEEFVKIVLFYEKFSENILYGCLLNLIIKNNIYFVFVLLWYGDVDVNYLNVDGFGLIYNCIRGLSVNKDFLLKFL